MDISIVRPEVVVFADTKDRRQVRQTDIQRMCGKSVSCQYWRMEAWDKRVLGNGNVVVRGFEIEDSEMVCIDRIVCQIAER
jgi:hypothetical protein